MRSALFCIIKRRTAVITYRRFGTNYRTHLEGSKNIKKVDFLTLEEGTEGMCRNVGKELPMYTT